MADYTLREAAKTLGVKAPTVARWIDEGKLFEVPVNGGVRLVSEESVIRVKRERDLQKASA